LDGAPRPVEDLADGVAAQGLTVCQFVDAIGASTCHGPGTGLAPLSSGTSVDVGMSEMDVSRVLAQIRTLQSQASFKPATAPAAAAAPTAGFDSLLKGAIDQVNQTQQTSARLQESFARGDRNTDLSTVMLAGAKAQVEFRGMVEVRNRLVAAYQDIMNLPL